MQSVRVEKKILDFIKKVKERGHVSGTITNISSRSIKFMCNKDKKCFSCPHHRDQLAGIEIGRQALALEAVESNSPWPCETGWIKVNEKLAKMASTYAWAYGRPIKAVFEQALVEYLTRPKECLTCECYKQDEEDK